MPELHFQDHLPLPVICSLLPSNIQRRTRMFLPSAVIPVSVLLVSALQVGGAALQVPLSTSVNNPLITLEGYGTIHGTSDGLVEAYLGLPYAEPPIGDLRFRKPVNAKEFFGTFNATSFGNSCLQQSYTLPYVPGLNYTALEGFVPRAAPSEDCLNLNVFRPASVQKHAKLPVVVWFYGGAFMTGSSSSYNATSLVSRSIELGSPIIYVSLNYRVNAFGFLGGQEVLDAGVANLGIYDQALALQWVQSRISDFGGDPDKVAIWGQSAGGASVATHMVLNANVTKPPFRAAIIHSTFNPPIEAVANSMSQHYYDYLVQNTECSSALSTLDCLRKVPAQALLEIVNTTPAQFSPHALNFTWSLGVDNVLLNKTLKEYIRTGHYAKVPLLGGQVDDEGTLFSVYSQHITTDEEFTSFIYDEYFADAHSAAVHTIAQHYPENPALGSPFNTGNRSALTSQFKRISAFQNDYYFSAGRREAFSFFKSTQKVWSFLWKRRKDLLYIGSVHGGELPEFYSTQPSDRVGTDAIINFVNHLDPNHPTNSSAESGLSSIYWPPYNKADQTLLFSDNATEAYSTITDDYRKAAMEATIEMHRMLGQ